MLRRSTLLPLIVALPILIVLLARIFGPGQLPPLEQRLIEYGEAGYLKTSSNQLVWNASQDFIHGSRFEDHVAINSPPRPDAINIYVLSDDPKQYFRDVACNCAYLGQENTIVCDDHLFSYFENLINIGQDDLAAASWLGAREREEIILNTNANFRLFITKWIIGHEIGHLVLDHGKNSAPIPVRINEEQADQFVIEHLDPRRSGDLFWVWLGLSNVVSGMYGTVDQMPGEGTPFPTIEVVDRPETHPAWLVRLLDMGMSLLRTYPVIVDGSGYFEAMYDSIHRVQDGPVASLACRVESSSLAGPATTESTSADVVVREGDAATAADAAFYLRQGFNYRRLTEFDAAIASLTVGIDLLSEATSGGSGPPPEQLVQAYIERGADHFVLGNYALAMADWETVSALQPGNPVALSNLGFAYHALGQFDEAQAHWQRAVDLEPTIADGWAGLGIALHGKGQNQDAIAAYQRALALDSSYASLEWLRYEGSWTEEAVIVAAGILASIEHA